MILYNCGPPGLALSVPIVLTQPVWQQERGRCRPGPNTPGHSFLARLGSADCASRRHLTAPASGVGLENNHLDSELFPLSFVAVVFNRSIFLAHFPPSHFLSCLCENVKGAQLKLSPGRSFELFCLHSAIPKGLHGQRGSSQGWRLSMDVDMAQWLLHLAWSAALSCEPQAAVTALRGAPWLSRGHRDGGED